MIAGAPCVVVWLAGVAPNAKFGGALTTSVTVAVWVNAPLIPVMVSVELPVGVVARVVTLSVDVAVAGFVVKVPVAPVGNPATLSVTEPVKPPDGVMVTG